MRFRRPSFVLVGALLVFHANAAFGGEDSEDASRAKQLLQQGTQSHFSGQFADAIEQLSQALEIYRKLYPQERFPKGQADLAETLNVYGIAMSGASRLPEAQAALVESLRMRRALFPPDTSPDQQIKIASTLINLSGANRGLGKLNEATEALREAALICEKYESEDPDNEAESQRLFAIAQNGLGTLLFARAEYSGALHAFQETRGQFEALYPVDQFPDGSEELANCINNIGVVLCRAGRLTESRRYLERALAMRRKVYAGGHPRLAECMSNLAAVLNRQGESEAAIQLYHEALENYERFFPQDTYPAGHPSIAITLDNLTVAYYGAGRPGDGLDPAERALQMFRKLVPKSRFPDGHPALAKSINNSALLHYVIGDFDKANELYAETEQMLRRLYSTERSPLGHPDLAGVLRARAETLRGAGDVEQAAKLFHESLAMYERLYPVDKFPNGQSTTALCLYGIGLLHLGQGEDATAVDFLMRAVGMQQRLSDAFLAEASEAESLNFLTSYRFMLDGLLSAPDPNSIAYDAVWSYKGATFRALADRRRALDAVGDDDTRARYEHYLDVREKLAKRALEGAVADPEAFANLSREKERLERELATTLSVDIQVSGGRMPTREELARVLPKDAAFIDFFAYGQVSFDAENRGDRFADREQRYVAYVTTRERTGRRIDIGPVSHVDKVVDQWRRDIAASTSSDAATRLRDLVWNPISSHLPEEIRTLYLALDGRLTAVPWAALPLEDGDILLQDFALATVPHGPYLATSLMLPSPSPYNAASLLAVGDVDYGKPAGATPTSTSELRNPDMRQSAYWPLLPDSRTEIDLIRELAGDNGVQTLSQGEATVDAVLQSLKKVRIAHLATHGFFAGPEIRSALNLPEDDFALSSNQQRASSGGRNPLVLSGLVLAGANTHFASPSQGQEGVLTAEMIAGRSLDDLNLAVLSACETGLGEVAGGESIYGLTRAFHLAGCENVVASLWKVEDAATSALMDSFYRKLWVEGLAPIAALREAQLNLYRDPDRVEQVARTRGIDFRKPRTTPASPSKSPSLPTRLWAGFILSGAGR